MKIKRLILYLLVAGLGWAWSGDAQATVVTLTFWGQISDSTLADPAFAEGANFTGILTYDTSYDDQADLDPSFGQYFGINFSVSFPSTGAMVASAGQPSILVENNLAGVDSFKIADSNLTVTGASLPVTMASVIFTNVDQTAFASDSLPVSFNLADFNIPQNPPLLTLWYVDQASHFFYATGPISNITFEAFEAIPLPPSILLFGTALGGWLAAGIIRRSRRFF
jgi:hypothetical protein